MLTRSCFQKETLRKQADRLRFYSRSGGEIRSHAALEEIIKDCPTGPITGFCSYPNHQPPRRYATLGSKGVLLVASKELAAEFPATEAPRRQRELERRGFKTKVEPGGFDRAALLCNRYATRAFCVTWCAPADLTGRCNSLPCSRPANLASRKQACLHLFQSESSALFS